MSPALRRDRFGRPLPRAGGEERTETGEPEGTPRSVDEACRRGIALFNEQRFFEAHELFEWAWKAEGIGDGDHAFWKAVTQVAVGCCHAQRGNDRGALALLERAAEQLGSFPAPHCGIDPVRLAALARGVADQVRRHGASARLDFPKFPTAGRDPA